MVCEDDVIIDSFRRNGWHAIALNASERAPAYIHTVGLQQTFKHPEIIIFGWDPFFSHAVLWDIVLQVESGRTYSEDDNYQGLWKGQAATFLPVHRTQHLRYLGYAASFCRRAGSGDLEALQLLWPDPAGHFPGSTDCDPAVAEAQPRLDMQACVDDLAAFLLDA